MLSNIPCHELCDIKKAWGIFLIVNSTMYFNLFSWHERVLFELQSLFTCCGYIPSAGGLSRCYPPRKPSEVCTVNCVCVCFRSSIETCVCVLGGGVDLVLFSTDGIQFSGVSPFSFGSLSWHCGCRLLLQSMHGCARMHISGVCTLWHSVISAISTVHALKVSLSKLRSQSMLRHSRRLSQLNSGSREPNSRERTSLGLNHGKAKNDCEH